MAQRVASLEAHAEEQAEDLCGLRAALDARDRELLDRVRGSMRRGSGGVRREGVG